MTDCESMTVLEIKNFWPVPFLHEWKVGVRRGWLGDVTPWDRGFTFGFNRAFNAMIEAANEAAEQLKETDFLDFYLPEEANL